MLGCAPDVEAYMIVYLLGVVQSSFMGRRVLLLSWG